LSVRNILAPVASRVIRCFLIEPKREWSILELSKVTSVSYGHVHKLVATLMRLGFCRKTKRNRIVVANPAELLSRWASYYDFALLSPAKHTMLCEAYSVICGSFHPSLRFLIMTSWIVGTVRANWMWRQLFVWQCSHQTPSGLK